MIADEKVSPIKPEAPGEAAVMCVIPQVNIQAVYNWLNSDGMKMPQDEVRSAIQFLASARVLTEEPPDSP